jgi:hypothetical protein
MPGLGRVQRGVRRALIAHPTRTTRQLADWCYPRLQGPLEVKHFVGIWRACQRVAVKVGGGRVFGSRTRDPLRNRVIVLLSGEAGLRACQIANLTRCSVRPARSAA